MVSRGPVAAGPPLTAANWLRAVALVVSVLAGVLLGWGATLGARRLPSDLERTGVILRALRDPGSHPEVVVFGDSVMMSGVDARIVQADAHIAGPVWNLSSTGQTLAESALYYQELPESVAAVVQAARLPRLVALDDMAFNPHVGNTFRINGYRPTLETQRLLVDAFGNDVLRPLLDGPLRSVFESRWLVRQYLDTSIRRVVRTDLDADHAIRDLIYPQAFTRPLEPDKLQAQMEQTRTVEACGACVLRNNYVRAIQALRVSSQEHHRRLLVVISPVHPALQNMYDVAVPHLQDAIREGRFGDPRDVIEATRLLEAREFFDFQHPTPEGAAKLSRLVAQRLLDHR